MCHKMIIAMLVLFPVLSFAQPARSLPVPKHGGVYVIAHRGAHEGIPENTLAAYARAIELGCDFVEVDFRKVKDGSIVSVHNDDVDSYTQDAKGLVKDFTLAELKAMDIGSRVGPEWKNERVPEMNEVMALCRGKINLYVDLKAAPVEEVAKALRAHELAAHTVWYANAEEYDTLQKVCPECNPMPDTGKNTPVEEVVGRFHPLVISPSFGVLSKEYVDRWHAAGVKLFIDEEGNDYRACWRQLVEWGVDGIQTDHPTELIAWLKERAGAKDR